MSDNGLASFRNSDEIESSNVKLEIHDGSYDNENNNDGTLTTQPPDLPNQGWTPYLVFCSTALVMGSMFMFAYNAVIINEPQEILRNFINQSYSQRYNATIDKGSLDTIWLFTVSNYLIGGTIGALVGGVESDRLGRKKALIFNSIVGVIAGAFMLAAPFVNVFELLLVGRLIAGIHCGSCTAIVPEYLAELAPLSLRGASGTLNQVALCIGALTASVLALPVILSRPNEPNTWPFLFFPCMLLPFVQTILLDFTVESPRWLVMVKRNESEANKCLLKLRGNAREVESEIQHLIHEREIEDDRPKLSYKESFIGCLGWPLVICIFMQLSQQFSGINASTYYSDSLFNQVGLEEPVPQYASLGVTTTAAIMTIIAMFLVERLGRRILMIAGLSGMLLACILLTIFMTLSYLTPVFNYITIVSLFLFSSSFAVGPGPIPLFIFIELSLPRYRPPTIAICIFINWVANMTVSFTFPTIEQTFNTFSFVPFLIFNFLALTFVTLFLPETKGIPSEENVRKLRVRKLQICTKSPEIDQQILTEGL